MMSGNEERLNVCARTLKTRTLTLTFLPTAKDDDEAPALAHHDWPVGNRPTNRRARHKKTFETNTYGRGFESQQRHLFSSTFTSFFIFSTKTTI